MNYDNEFFHRLHEKETRNKKGNNIALTLKKMQPNNYRLHFFS